MRFIVLKTLVSLYRGLVSPVIHWIAGPGFGCRFHPSCSQYAQEAIEKRGWWSGGALAVRRVCRCHPWTPGGFDPVPEPDRTT